MSKADLDLLSAALDYDASTGVFRWKIKPKRTMSPGDAAGGRDTYGYVRICVHGKQYSAHRIAWLFQTGSWPHKQIDHIDQDKTNNRWSNLREATTSQNKQNISKPNANNCSGYLGVTWHAQSSMWVARIGINGKYRSLGLFVWPQDAHQAYLKAKKELHPASHQ